MALLDIREFQHLSITCADPDRSRAFYRDVLGFADMDTRPAFPGPGRWLRRHNFVLHLIGLDPDQVTQHRASWSSQDHYAFVIEDYDAALAALKEAGIEVVESPSAQLGLKQIYLRDPDGHVIELDARGFFPGT